MAADLRPAAVLAELMVPNWFECGVPGRTATSRLIATAFSLVRSMSKVREHMQLLRERFSRLLLSAQGSVKGRT
jgi:hypothetical protein